MKCMIASAVLESALELRHLMTVPSGKFVKIVDERSKAGCAARAERSHAGGHEKED